MSRSQITVFLMALLALAGTRTGAAMHGGR